MKKSVLIFVLLISCGLAQAQGLKVTYAVSVNKDYFESFKKSKRDRVVSEVMKTMQNFRFVSYELLIDEDESLFYMVQRMPNDANKRMVLATIYAGFSETLYYSNFATGEKLQQRTARGKEYLISVEDTPIDWQIKPETKTINGYKAIKAIAYTKLSYQGKTVKRKMTAWFTTAINKPAGLGQYSGLPGLVLELHRAGKIYRMTSITEIDKEIEKPTEGERIALSAFRNMWRSE